MAGAGYRDWTAGDVPTADQFDTYIQHQTVMRFADAATRDTALSTVKAEGMCAFLLDTNTLTVYSGAAWSTIGPLHGVPTDWTPTVTQSGAVTVTENWAVYSRFGRWIHAQFHVSCTASGTAGSAIIIGGLPATAAGAGIGVLHLGVGAFVDASDTNRTYPFAFNLESSTTLSLHKDSTIGDIQPRLGETGNDAFALALASGDTIGGTFSYVAAADA